MPMSENSSRCPSPSLAGIYAAESAVYRTGGLLNNMMHSLDRSGDDGGQVTAKGIEEYARAFA